MNRVPNFHNALAAVAALLIAGCATTPTASETAAPVPPDRLLAYQQTAEDDGSIVVIRDAGMLGGGCHYAFSIDGELAARIAPSESATFHVSPGEHVLRYGRDPQGRGLCGMGQTEWTQRETLIEQGQTKRFRLSLDANGKGDIQRAD